MHKRYLIATFYCIFNSVGPNFSLYLFINFYFLEILKTASLISLVHITLKLRIYFAFSSFQKKEMQTKYLALLHSTSSISISRISDYCFINFIGTIARTFFWPSDISVAQNFFALMVCRIHSILVRRYPQFISIECSIFFSIRLLTFFYN